MDNRILDFRNEHLSLPEAFLQITMRKMILASGDGFRDRFVNSAYKEMTDIEYYTKYSKPTYNIFCLKYGYNNSEYDKNITYLTSNPALNIVICLIDFDNESELIKFCLFFENSITYINTDDIRFYIPGRYVHKLLLEHGIADGVETEKSKSDNKYGYYTQDFLNSKMFDNQIFRRQYLKVNKNGGTKKRKKIRKAKVRKTKRK